MYFFHFEGEGYPIYIFLGKEDLYLLKSFWYICSPDVLDKNEARISTAIWNIRKGVQSEFSLNLTTFAANNSHGTFHPRQEPNIVCI